MSKSRSLNKALLIGNLTRNPVLRETANGVMVCTSVLQPIQAGKTREEM